MLVVLFKPAVRYEGRKLVCSFDPPVFIGDAMMAILNASRLQLLYEMRKHKGG